MTYAWLLLMFKPSNSNKINKSSLMLYHCDNKTTCIEMAIRLEKQFKGLASKGSSVLPQRCSTPILIIMVKCVLKTDDGLFWGCICMVGSGELGEVTIWRMLPNSRVIMLMVNCTRRPLYVSNISVDFLKLKKSSQV